MTHGRRLSYAVCGAVILTALSWLFAHEGGEFLLVPGMALDGLFNSILLSMSTDDPAYVNSRAAFSVLFYSGVFYLLPLFYRELRAG